VTSSPPVAPPDRARLRRCRETDQPDHPRLEAVLRAFYRSALYPFLQRINAYLMRWIRKKYKRLRPFKKAHACWKHITRQHPRLLAHWAWINTHW